MPILNMVGGGKKGGNIGEPLNLAVTTSRLDATITWEDDEIRTIPPTTFQKSELVRKIGSAPTSPSDGTLVVTETVKDTYKTTGYVDQGLTDGTTYYYRVFSYSDLGGISYCDAVSVTISIARLPAEYQEVEYITSSGTQWIDTGLRPSNTLSFDFAITPSGSNQSEHAILGDEWSADSIFLMFENNKYKFHDGGAFVFGPSAQTGVKTTITLSNTGMTVNSVSYSLTAGSSFINNYNIGLFSTGGGYLFNRKGIFSLWEMVVKDNGTDVRDFVPCYRIADSVVGMYDLVNDVFYTNDGTGTFTAGPDVN